MLDAKVWDLGCTSFANIDYANDVVIVVSLICTWGAQTFAPGVNKVAWGE